MSRNLFRLHEERNWYALDITQTVDSCTVANAKPTVSLWRVSRDGKRLPGRGQRERAMLYCYCGELVFIGREIEDLNSSFIMTTDQRGGHRYLVCKSIK